MAIPKTVKEVAAVSPSGMNLQTTSAQVSIDEETPMMEVKFWVTFLTNKYPASHYPQLTEQEEIDAIVASIPVILVEAQREKHIRLEKEAYAAKLKAEMHVPASAEELLKVVVKRGQELAELEMWGSPFVLDKHREPVYKLLSWYFTGDRRFETEGPKLLKQPDTVLSLKKGILLAGKRGVGKSVALELFARNPFQPYVFFVCEEIENEFDQVGSKIIEHHWFNFPTTKPEIYYGHRLLGACYDDIGAEENGRHFGKESNFMQKILTGRYRNCRGPYTHLTTNASLKELKVEYGDRAFDRFHQLFNLIEFLPTATNLRQ
jgi:hypothetical protein